MYDLLIISTKLPNIREFTRIFVNKAHNMLIMVYGAPKL